MKIKREILLIGLSCILSLLLSLSCKLDITPPEVRFISPWDGDTVPLLVTVEIEVKDKNFKRVELYVDGNKTKVYETAYITDNLELSEGNHTLTAKAFDKDGNRGEAKIGIFASPYSPPNKPTITSGPSTGAVGMTYDFTTSTTDPYGDDIAYQFNWGDNTQSDWSGFVRSGEPITLSKSWSSAGTYLVKARAKNTHGIASAWSDPHSITIVTNNPPNKPMAPSGPSSGEPESLYNYTTSTTDPDGDSISYQFDWDDQTQSGWSDFLPSGTPITMSKSWAIPGTYWVKARAKDNKGAISDWSDGKQVTISGTWHLATPSAQWSARCNHTSVVFNNKIWVLGGYYENDVWYSTDGVNWTRATASAGWSGRYGHTSVVFDNKIWVLGGYDGSFKNDVWYSPDGVSWTQATANASWSPRYGHTSVVFDNKIWVLGGNAGSYRNDVWYSSDGVNWTQATASAGWSRRRNHTSVVFDNKIWVLGGCDGNYKNDVWYSTDGVNWTQATASAGWSERVCHTSVVFDNKIWILGGDDGSNRNDVWYSPNGVTWTQTPQAGWSARYDHTSVVFNNKIWVLGGYDGSHKNDVWYWP
uniref:PKD domain-containing protein n=1 Tax=candidate division WOR-3 bacterium TaxID=2052148 RepID=A0A7C6A8F3_UNCW3